MILKDFELMASNQWCRVQGVRVCRFYRRVSTFQKLPRDRILTFRSGRSRLLLWALSTGRLGFRV